ncbi:MAG: hypothetical protein QOH21_2510, partial [Acidobacteriota bacterium]|nr:hypothetical protein [Acidobacteriota bacterium]
MIPSRRVAILFVTTLLSTRHLLAQSDISVANTHAPRSGAHAGSVPAKVPSRVSQVHEAPRVAVQRECTAPTLIGPGDANGTVTAASPIRFRWGKVEHAERYRVVYSLDNGNGTENVLGETKKTELEATVPPGVIKWRVYTIDHECEAVSGSLKFISPGAPPACQQPSASVTPATARATAGERVTLTATATGTAPVTLQWYEGAAGDRSKPSGSGTTFTSAPLTVNTSFWCEASNACGTAASNVVAVTVTPACTAPAITTQPQSTTISEGQSVTLSMAASGTAPFTYRWFQGAAGDRSKPVG